MSVIAPNLQLYLLTLYHYPFIQGEVVSSDASFVFERRDDGVYIKLILKCQPSKKILAIDTEKDSLYIFRTNPIGMKWVKLNEVDLNDEVGVNIYSAISSKPDELDGYEGLLGEEWWALVTLDELSEQLSGCYLEFMIENRHILINSLTSLKKLNAPDKLIGEFEHLIERGNAWDDMQEEVI